MRRPEAFWKFNTTYTDLTPNIRSNSTFTFISDADDYIYIGYPKRFVGLYVNLSTNGSYEGLTYEYNTGTEWITAELIDNYEWNESKYVRWNLPLDWLKQGFSDTDPHSATPPDNVERYWIRIKSTSVTTAAVVEKIRIIPNASYTTATKISEFLQISRDFTHSTIPSDLTVENMIRRAEDRIDHVSYKSFRFNISENELVQHNRFGIFPRRRDLQKVYSVKLWNGSAWTTLTEGRNRDYFVDYERGMIYFARMFALPATYGMQGRYYLFGFGEYAYSVQLNYAYGRDPETNPEFYIIENLATKIVSRELLKMSDFSALLVSGTDKVAMESKVRLLGEEIETELEELKGTFIW